MKSMAAPSLGRETLTLFAGRAANLALSLSSLFLYPVLLGPKAHGVLQYYTGLYLLLLGFLNGCAAPMLAHFIAIYRVSEPSRQGPYIRQVFRWFFLLLLSLWILYPFLANPMGFGWIFAGVAFSGLAQLLSAAEYGAGRLGPTTWFPVLILFLRLVLVCGMGWQVSRTLAAEQMEDWAQSWIPPLLVLASVPSLIWMMASFWVRRRQWFVPGGEALPIRKTYFPWREIKILGVSSMVGQLIYQVFTRSLVPLSEQLHYPREQVGYLGLAMQGFGLVVFLAGIFSVSSYPWLVSAWEAGDRDRFSRIQSEAWRMSALVGGWLVASMVGLAHPMVWVVLGKEYRGDIDLMVLLIRVGALAGAFMLVGEFHLRMLLSLTQMTKYLIALALGFATVIPFLTWVILERSSMAFFVWSLPIGVGGAMVISVLLSPRTEGFYRVSGLAILGGTLATAAAYSFEGETLVSLVIEGSVLFAVYGLWAWMTGLARHEDLARVLRAGKPRVEEMAG
jgi:O-antigen/teichoic acid export membrane protein